MLHPRHTRGYLAAVVGPLGLALLASGCHEDPESAVAEATEYPAVVRIVEVAGAPAKDQPSFVELRNDSEAAADLAGWKLDVGGKKTPLKARPVKDSAEQARGASANAIAPHGLALVVDEAMPADAAAALACEAPIATTRASLGSEHAAPGDVLSSALELQSLRHCIPVLTAKSLATNLKAATFVSLANGSAEVDRAEAKFGKAPTGIAYERRGLDKKAFDLSPAGSSPGARNFYRSDQALLHEQHDVELPLGAMSSSPWRVGNLILTLGREAAQLEASGDAAGAKKRRDEIDAVMKGKLPHNPLVEPFEDLVEHASKHALGSFFQINEPVIVDGLAAAKGRGLDVRLTTDASFAQDPHYTEGFARLKAAGVGLVFDFNAQGIDRPPLSHNKFLTVDGQWLWTGSFNPIEDEPHRIHADNSLLIRSKTAAKLHEQEFETMFGGKFGVDKRGVGVGGGRFNVDGAEISVRFSPGLSPGVLERRAKEMVAKKDALKACNVKLTNGQNAVSDRYRGLDPCGGPYDLIMGELARATSSVYFVSFSLSFDEMGAILLERMGSGVDVRGVVDPTVASRGVVEDVNLAGGDVRYTPNSDPECPAYVQPRYTCPKNPNKVWLHHKFIVIDYGTDHPVVITGSHNMSTSAEDKNDEALLVVRDRAVAESYFRMFREAYDHPQTMGVNRDTTGLPELAITEVLGSANAAKPQYAELTNVGSASASLSGLELWNRRGVVLAVDSGDSLAPGARAIVCIGDPSQLGVASGTRVLKFPPKGSRATIEPTTALVLRSASDGRWIATYDPYTAEQNLPEGVTAASPGASQHWTSISSDRLDALTVELLGVNTTPTATKPTWSPKGLYSDWADEHDVNTTSLVLTLAPLDPWTSGEPSPGR